MRRFFILFIFFIFFVSDLPAQGYYCDDSDYPLETISPCEEGVHPFVLITVPKSGSHLIIKALHLLTRSTSIWHTRFPSLFYIPIKSGFLYTHLCLSPELEEDYAQLPLLKKIINIRDLRDVAVSMIHQIIKAPWPGMTSEERENFKNLSFDEQLLYVIDYEYDVIDIASYAPNSLQVSLSQVALQSLRLCADSRNLVCRYEDLVGEQGGGSREAQVRELYRISEYLNIPVSHTQIEQIADVLYGNDFNPFGKGGFDHLKSTFHQGKIGGWRGVFKEKHKQAFKEKLGEALISLGYEQDYHW